MTDGNNYKKNRAIVRQLMELKIIDNVKDSQKLRRARHKMRSKVEEILGPQSRRCRSKVQNIKSNGAKLCEKLRDKSNKKFNFLKGKYITKEDSLESLNKSETCDCAEGW